MDSASVYTGFHRRQAALRPCVDKRRAVERFHAHFRVLRAKYFRVADGWHVSMGHSTMSHAILLEVGKGLHDAGTNHPARWHPQHQDYCCDDAA